MIEVTKNQAELMQHTIGLNSGGGRNFFGTSLGYSDSNEFLLLVDLGLATTHKAPDWSGDDVIYRLTSEGVEVAKASMPRPKKLTRSQQNYQDYLHCECDESFAEWMGFA